MDEIRLREPNAPEGLTVVAARQTSGRGRMGRAWQDEPGQSLLFSTLLRPNCSPETFQLFPIAAGLAVVRAIDDLYSVDARLKWPNDVLIGDRKLAGVLVTSRVSGDVVESATIGIGINLLAVPTGVQGDAVALVDVVSQPVERRVVLDAVLRNLEDVYSAVLRHKASSLVEAWTDRAAWIGEWIDVITPQGILSGRMLGIDLSGSLLISPDGARQTSVAVGDVSRGIRRVRNSTEM